MQNSSRTRNAKINIIIGLFSQVSTLILTFVGRRLFIKFLSVEYLGINGLFSNILSVLSLAELGLGCVISFSLYKPVADKDYSLICGLIKYYKKVYRYIAFSVFLFGVLLIPFMQYIVSSTIPKNDLVLYYLLFLLNSILTYFIAQDVALLYAYQENRVYRIVILVKALFQQIVHIIILTLIPNYFVYVFSTVICTAVSNIILEKITYKRHPFLNQNKEAVFKIEKKKIFENIKSATIYKMSAVIINSTDNILISSIVSTAAVGLYSNYIVIITGLQNLLSIIITSLMSGIGNLYAESNKKKMLEIFSSFVLLFHFISCYCSISLYYLFNRFIDLWIGPNYIMSKQVVFAISFNFYITYITAPIWSFREATGQFTSVKFIMLVAAIINIGLSIILGLKCGVFGILIATAISQICTVFWYEPAVLFKNIFVAKQQIYWIQQTKYIICTVICFYLCGIVSQIAKKSLSSIVIDGIVFFVICSIVFFVANIKSPQFTILKNRMTKNNI